MADRREHLDPRRSRKIRDFLVAGQRIWLGVGLEAQLSNVPLPWKNTGRLGPKMFARFFCVKNVEVID